MEKAADFLICSASFYHGPLLLPGVPGGCPYQRVPEEQGGDRSQALQGDKALGEIPDYKRKRGESPQDPGNPGEGEARGLPAHRQPS